MLPQAALGWDVNSFSAGSEKQLISLQNQARASAGRQALKLDTDLRTIARWRSKDMVDRDYFSHTIPGPGADRNVFWYMQNKYDYCFKVAGENIGQATWPGASESDVTAYIFGLFMDSEGHRSNILGKAWDVVAVGAYRTTGDRYVWTVLFADRCGGGGGSATPKPTPKDTPKPTPKDTPKPTPKPDRATPRPEPTERDRPKDTPKPSPKATPKPRPTPTSEPSPSVIPTPAPTPSPAPTPPPVALESASERPPIPVWNGGIVPAGGLRVVDPPAGPGLVDSILSTVSARFFGS